MLENFSVYLSYKLKSFSLVEKLHEYKLKKTPIDMIFALVLSNTSISPYRILLEDFPFLSLFLLEKINSGATNAVTYVQNAGKISENACLWKCFAGDTMFQTCQFSKKSLPCCIAVREKQRVRLSHYRVFCRENQELTELFCRGLLVGDSITSYTFSTCKFQGEEVVLHPTLQFKIFLVE